MPDRDGNPEVFVNDDEARRALIGTIPYGSCPLEGIATSGQPAAETLPSLAAAGYRAVLDIRAPEEPRGYDEPATVRAAGMDYLALPVTQPTLDDGTFDRFRSIVGDPERRPLLVHCASANRVGALLLPYLLLDERMPLPRAMQVATAVGMRSPELASLALAYARRRGAP